MWHLFEQESFPVEEKASQQEDGGCPGSEGSQQQHPPQSASCSSGHSPTNGGQAHPEAGEPEFVLSSQELAAELAYQITLEGFG